MDREHLAQVTVWRAVHLLNRCSRWCARAEVARRAAEQPTREGTPVRFAGPIFIPEDETCVHMYRAGLIDAVRLAAARTSVRFELISEAATESGDCKA
jgi:hypothetical protein